MWLPEPIATDEAPGERLERTETLTMGFLLLLERLTPIERAVFVLHDVLDYGHDEVAEAVGRTSAACRQALHRARKQVKLPAKRSAADRAHAARVAERFVAASLAGDAAGLLALLAPDVVMTSDGGGVVRAAIHPVVGPDRVSRLITNSDRPARPPRSAGRAVRAERVTRRRGQRGRDVARLRHRGGRGPGRGDPGRRQPGQARTPRRHPAGGQLLN